VGHVSQPGLWIMFLKEIALKYDQHALHSPTGGGASNGTVQVVEENASNLHHYYFQARMSLSSPITQTHCDLF
jgi:hypothetical protein